MTFQKLRLYLVSPTKTNQLVLIREVIALCYKRMKHVDALHRKIKAFETLQQGNYCGLKNQRWNLSTPETILKCFKCLLYQIT
jgi:hypothetical protein